MKLLKQGSGWLLPNRELRYSTYQRHLHLSLCESIHEDVIELTKNICDETETIYVDNTLVMLIQCDAAGICPTKNSILSIIHNG